MRTTRNCTFLFVQHLRMASRMRFQNWKTVSPMCNHGCQKTFWNAMQTKQRLWLLGSEPNWLSSYLPSVTVAGVDVPVQTNPVRNLGAMFDSGITMSAQAASVIKSANYHLTNISRARKMHTTVAAKLAVHTLVTCRLDNCNSLLIGINKSLITRLQNVQRTFARIIVKRRKYDTITI